MKKLYDYYKTKQNPILNYNLAAAYLGMRGRSKRTLVCQILCERFKWDWQKNIIRKELQKCSELGTSEIKINKLRLETTMDEVLEKYVKINFDSILKHSVGNSDYPIEFKSLIERFKGLQSVARTNYKKLGV